MAGGVDEQAQQLRLRLDALEQEERESGQGIHRLDGRADHLAARVDYLAERMNDGFARLDARLDTLTAAILAARRPTATDPVLTRVKKLEREVEALRKKA